MKEQLVRASTLLESGEIKLAKAALTTLLETHPKNSDCLHLLGVIANKEKNYVLASNLIAKAVGIYDRNPYYYFNLAVSFKAQNNLSQALECYEKCIELAPTISLAHLNKGIVLKQLHRIDEAIKSHSTAIKLNDRLLLAYVNRGLAYQAKRQLLLAKQDFLSAVGIKAEFAEAHANLGNVYRELKNYSLAIESYGKALSLNRDLPYLQGLLLHTKMCIADWQGFDSNLKQTLDDVSLGKRVSPSHPLLALIDDPIAHLKCTQTWMSHNHPENDSLGSFDAIHFNQTLNRRIKVAYISPDFRDHPVAYLMANVFELHSKEQFELYALSLTSICDDGMHSRISKAFEHFFYVNDQSDKEIAQLCRSLSIDIVIDLSGLTEGSRPGIFSYRPAPLQVGYIGFLGSMGASYFDYIITDSTITTPMNRPYFSEKILYLPSYQANDQHRFSSAAIFAKADLGISENTFVYCSLNSTYKITPDIFKSWMTILLRVPNSALLLLAENTTAEANLRNNALTLGVDPNRIFFCNRINRSDYLARYKSADLFLDTSPYNAGTTASDALWAGLPVLTIVGKSFASRIGASLLNAIGLPELITYSLQDYESKAVELGLNQNLLTQTKDKLRRNSKSMPLFDAPSFTVTLEAGFRQIFLRHFSNLKPADTMIRSDTVN